MTLRVLVDIKALESRSKESGCLQCVVPERLLTPGFVKLACHPRRFKESASDVSALVGGEDSSELLDLLVAEGRNEVVDVELLDRTLDDALDDVVEAEVVHETTDGARLQVEDAG
jgi:hypothetical protein